MQALFATHSTRLADTCAHALDAPPLNCRPPSPVFSPRHAFAITHTAALRIRAPHAPRSLQSSHVPRCSAPDVLVFAHDPTHRRLRVPSTAVRAPDARTHTNPHVLDPTRPAVPRRALTPDYVRPPPLRPRLLADRTRTILHEPTRPRSHTSTCARHHRQSTTLLTMSDAPHPTSYTILSLTDAVEDDCTMHATSSLQRDARTHTERTDPS